MDDVRATLMATMREIADEMGLSLTIDGIADDLRNDRQLKVSTSVTRDGPDERTYRIDVDALPGGCGHIAHAIVMKDRTGGPCSVETMQLRRMLAEHARRMTRLDTILSSGYDPLRPPMWSIETHVATFDIMSALGARLDEVVEFGPSAGGIDATVPGLEDESTAFVRDSTLEWSRSVAVDRKWTYDHGTREIRIMGMSLPETVRHAIHSSSPRLCDLVDDDVLGRVPTRVESARNVNGCTVLKLMAGWRWIAPTPSGAEYEWRRPL